MIHVKLGNKGFTLVEVLVAMIVFSLTLILILQGYLFAYRLNLQSLIKNEAVKIAQEEIEKLRNLPFSSISSRCGATCDPNSTGTNCKVSRKIRNVNVNFGLRINVVSDTNFKTVTVEVCTDRKAVGGKNISYSFTSIIARRGT